MSDDTAPALRAELISLRRQVWALAVLLAGSLLLSAAALGHALRAGRSRPQQPERDPAVLVGRSLYLRDDPERPYVRLRYLAQGAGLILADGGGRGQVHLTASRSGGRLALGSGPPGLVLQGAPARSSLVLQDSRGRQRLALDGGEVSRLALRDEQGRVRLELSCDAKGASLSLSDAGGMVRARLSQQGDEVRLRLLDAQGRVLLDEPRPGRP